jgi:microcompartment protein CcmK/EutM
LVLGKVIGNVWATRKDEKLTGIKLMIVRSVDLDYKEKETFVVAADSVGAGVGEIVLYCTGSSARQTEISQDRPVDAVIMAIVDKLEIDKK